MGYWANDWRVKGRIDFWDLVRGIGMITVIFAHAVNYLDGERFENAAVWVMSTYEMVVFFVVAGVVERIRSSSRSVGGSWSRLGKKAKALMIPYLACAVVAYLIFREWGFWEYLFNGGLWFLRVLFFVFALHELALVVVRWRGDSPGGWVLGVLAGSVVGWLAAEIPGIRTFRQLGYFFMWFEAGYLATRSQERQDWLGRGWTRMVYKWAPVGFGALIPALVMSAPNIRRMVIPIMALLGTISCMRMAEWLQDRQFEAGWRKVVSGVRFTGIRSLMFYILHVFVGHACCRYCPVLGLREWWVQVILAVPVFAVWYVVVWWGVRGGKMGKRLVG